MNLIDKAKIEYHLDNNENILNNSYNKINDFCHNDKILNGPAWSLYKEKLDNFNINIDKIRKISSELSIAIKNAINRINDYIASYTGNIPINITNLSFFNEFSHIENEIENLKRQIINLNDSLLDENNNDDNNINYEIDQLYIKINDLKKYEATLLELETICNEEEQKILLINDEINLLKNSIK